MFLKVRLIVVFAFLLTTITQAQTFKADDIMGNWQTGDGNLKVKISKTGNTYHGIIVWMKEPNDANGKPKLDQFNPDLSKRKNPILGNAIMIDKFKFVDENTWDNGTIYDARNGKTYSCIIKMSDQNKLDVRGYWGISLLGKTDTWVKIEQ